MSKEVRIKIVVDDKAAKKALSSLDKRMKSIISSTNSTSVAMSKASKSTIGFKVNTQKAANSMKSAAKEQEKLSNKSKKATKQTKRQTKETNKLAKALREAAASTAVFQGPLGPVAGRMSALGAAIGRVTPLQLALSGATVAVGIAMVKTISAGAEYEAQMFKLEAIIKATGMAAGRSAEEVNKFSIQLGIDTLTSAKAVRDAAGIVLTFKSITGEAFEKTLTLAQDLAATGFGDIKTSALGLSKALEDPIIGLNALRRSGVTFSESQKDVIKGLVSTGDKLKAQELILKAVEDQVGGAGKAEAKGLRGAWDTFGETLTNSAVGLNETIHLTDALGGAINVASAFVEGIGNFFVFWGEAIGTVNTALDTFFANDPEEYSEKINRLQSNLEAAVDSMSNFDEASAPFKTAQKEAERLRKELEDLKNLGKEGFEIKRDEVAEIPVGPTAAAQAEALVVQTNLIEAAALHTERIEELKKGLLSATALAVRELQDQQDIISTQLEITRKQIAGATQIKGESPEDFEKRKTDLISREQELNNLRVTLAQQGAEAINALVLEKGEPSEVDTKLEALRQALRSETEVIHEELTERLDFINEQLLEATDPTKRAELLNLQIQVENDAATRIVAIREKAAKSIKDAEDKKHKQDVSNFKRGLGTLAKENKAFHTANKAFMLAEAALKIPDAASQAYAFGLKISGGNPAVGAVTAAVAVAAQLANMQSIASESYSGGTGGSAPSAPAIPSAPEPPDFVQREVQNISITLIGEDTTRFTPEQIRDLIAEINEQLDEGVDLSVTI